MASARQRPVALFALTASALLAALALAVGATPARADAPASGSLLFVQQTDGGRLVHTASGHWKLRLEGISPAVSTFTDRPDRVAGRQGLRRFLGAWTKNGFAADPPNAALVIDGAPASDDVAMLTLSHPHFYPRRHLLTYRVRPLHGDAGGDLTRLQKRGDPLRAGRFESAGLFIDSSGAESVTQPVTFAISGITPGETISILVLGDGVEFSSTTPGVSLFDFSGPMPPTLVTVRPRVIAVTPEPSIYEGELSFHVSLALVAPAGIKEFELSIGEGSNIQVAAQIGSSRPVSIQPSTTFKWSGR